MGEFLKRVIEYPRRTPAVPCASGKFIFFQEANHSLSDHQTWSRALVLEVATGATTEVSRDANDRSFRWVEPTNALLWQRRNGDSVELWSIDADSESQSYMVGKHNPGPVLLQVVRLPDGDFGALFQEETITGRDPAFPQSTGRSFTSLPCLTFDQGVGAAKYTLLYKNIACRSPQASSAGMLRFDSGHSDFLNVLAGSGVEYFPYSGAMPNISPPNCSISQAGIAFMAVERGPPKVGVFTCETYFVPIPTHGQNFAPTKIFQTPSCRGWCASPVFSSDGKSMAFLREKRDSQIVVARSIFIVRDVEHALVPEEIVLTDASGEASPLYPDSTRFGLNSSILYFEATDVGRQKIFRINIKEGNTVMPMQIAPGLEERGSVLAYQSVKNEAGKELCFLTRSALTIPIWYSVLDVSAKLAHDVPGARPVDLGLSSSQVSEAWFPCEDRKIHTFILRPSNFDATKKYPVVVLLHGGPMSAWLDAMFPRWCPIMFAEQGYIVVLPNWSGSTGYGLEHRAASWGDLGGKAVRDLEACMDFIDTDPSLAFADTSRAVCVGGSYGGYLIVWIAGQPLAKRFKALMGHAPWNFGSGSCYATDIPDMLQSISMGDQNYDRGDVVGWTQRWDAATHGKEWSTPIFLSHGAMDNRCSVTNSIAAFTHAQIKGVESKLLVFPDESHFILKSENWYHWYKEVLAWCDKYSDNDSRS